MKIKHIFIAKIVLIFLAYETLQADERDAVIQMEGCTGFVVQDNLLVTAKHCRHPETVTVTLQNQAVTAHKVYTDSREDGPVIFRLQGGPYESLPIASHAPKMNDAVYSLGYPGGHWARIEGEIIGGNGTDLNYTNHRVATGNSGGPLLNSQGEVIGITLHVDANIAVHRSGFAGWRITADAIAQAKSQKEPRPKNTKKRTVIIVFSSENCTPCKQLKKDVREKHFDRYEFRFVQWNSKENRWSNPELYNEFWKTCQPKEQGLSFPTIWVQGTSHYRVGYTPARRGGLLGWLSSVVRHLLEGIIGRKEQPPVPETEPFEAPEKGNSQPIEPIPNPETPEAPEQPGQASAFNSKFSELINNVAALREDALKTKNDLETFKASGVVGKIKGIAMLRADKERILDHVEQIKGSVASVRNDFREQPLQFLWGLLGLLSGLVHRRFIN